jgi:type II secretory pathway component GspD/PulD (secretin)
MLLPVIKIIGLTDSVRLCYDPVPTGDSNELLELDLPETLKLIDLLDLVGKYLHLDYLYDAGTLQNQVVNLKVQGPIKVRDLYPLLESVLRFRGFVMTRKGNLVTVALAANIMDYDPALVDHETANVRYGDVVITRVFQMKYVDTASATNLLNNMKLGATIIPIAETGTLIVTGYAFRMERAEKLLEMIDKPGRPKQFKFRQLKYTMAKTLAPKVKTLIEQLGTISMVVGRGQGGW